MDPRLDHKANAVIQAPFATPAQVARRNTLVGQFNGARSALTRRINTGVEPANPPVALAPLPPLEFSRHSEFIIPRPRDIDMADLTVDINKPVYFWKPEGDVGFLGQWWPSSFEWEHDGERYTYANAEQ